MNITIPNYEILNFERETLVVAEVEVSRGRSMALLNALRQFQLSDAMARAEFDEVLNNNGLNANEVFDFLEGIISSKAVADRYCEKR